MSDRPKSIRDAIDADGRPADQVPKSIRDAFSADRFRTDGHRLIDAIADQLSRWHAREGLVLPWRDPAEARAAYMNERLSGGELVEDLSAIMRASTGLANPRCLGHQVPPPLPSAALAELVSAMINNGMAVAEMGPASVPIELAVINWMCDTLGLPVGSGGVMTSGGSLGNLTALLAMRQAKAGFDAWKAGAHEGPPLAVIVGRDAHYSIARTLGIMGWGEEGAFVADLDERHRMTKEGVERALARARASGRRVIGILAAAGSTATGAFDPLDELANIAEANQLWLHVDAAHGGGVILSAKHRHHLAGIERADSVVWDAHKLLMMPALVTAVLFKKEAHAYEAFAQRASYLFAEAQPDDPSRHSRAEATWWDLGTRTLECTKRAMAIELWCALRAQGLAWFGEVVDRLIALAKELAKSVTTADDFELALEPALNIVCYRHCPSGLTGVALDAHNRALRQRVVEDGTFYVVGTQLPGGYFLRSTIMNPLIERTDLHELLAHLRKLAAT